jgi:hypothetical protein
MGRDPNHRVRAAMKATGKSRAQTYRNLAAAKPATTAPLIRAKGGGLDVEIQRLEDLAASLGESAKDDTRADRSELISNYTKLVEALRRMKGDRPDIDQAEGTMVPVDEADKVLAARDNALIPLLKGMAKRLAPICANKPAAEVEADVENEVGQIMRQVEAAL